MRRGGATAEQRSPNARAAGGTREARRLQAALCPPGMGDLELPGARHSPGWCLLRAPSRGHWFSCRGQVAHPRGTLTTPLRVHCHSAAPLSFLWSTRNGAEQPAHPEGPARPEHPLSLGSCQRPRCAHGSQHRGTPRAKRRFQARGTHWQGTRSPQPLRFSGTLQPTAERVLRL